MRQEMRAGHLMILGLVVVLVAAGGCLSLLNSDSGPEEVTVDVPNASDGELSSEVSQTYPNLDIEDTAVWLEVGICFGDCPAYYVEVCGDGTVYYVGETYVDKAGFYKYNIPQSNVKSLINSAHELGYFGLNSTYNDYDADGSAVSTGVRLGSQFHTISKNDATTGPDELQNFERKIKRLTNVSALFEGENNELADERADELEEQRPFCYDESNVQRTGRDD